MPSTWNNEENFTIQQKTSSGEKKKIKQILTSLLGNSVCPYLVLKREKQS